MSYKIKSPWEGGPRARYTDGYCTEKRWPVFMEYEMKNSFYAARGENDMNIIKKGLLVGILIGTLFVLGGGFAYADLSNGLVAYYPFNSNAHDESGNGNNGIVTGATLTTDRFGNQNSAYHFTGSDVITCGNRSSLQTSSYSISAWIKYTGSLPHPYAPTIINKAAKGVEGYALFVHLSTIGTEPSNPGPGGPGPWPGNWQALYINENIAKDVWYMITVTYDHTTSRTSIYLNGKLKNSMTFTMATPVSKNLTIGHGYNTLGYYGTVGFTGDIDDVFVYNRALTPAEISELLEISDPCNGKCKKLGLHWLPLLLLEN
jgi:hypothetical protein